MADRKDKRYTVTLSPAEYRYVEGKASERYPTNGTADKYAIARYIESLIYADMAKEESAR